MCQWSCGFLDRNSSDARSVGWEMEKCPTLRGTVIPSVMIAISIDSYNQTTSLEVAEPLRSAEGGDTKPKVLIIKDGEADNTNTNSLPK